MINQLPTISLVLESYKHGRGNSRSKTLSQLIHVVYHNLLAPHDYKHPTIMSTSLAASFENDTIILSLLLTLTLTQGKPWQIGTQRLQC